LPVPSYVQNGHASQASTSSVFQNAKVEHPGFAAAGASQQSVTQEPIKPKFFTVYDDAATITHTPEDALKEGLGMVKAIKESLKKLELGSKLRQEVWDREIGKSVIPHFSFSPT